jgi:hypothetical protein
VIFAPDPLVNFISGQEASRSLDEYKEELKGYGLKRYYKAFAT